MLNLDSLNNAQREAVMHGSGALLVLAGPGSGKTHVITQRICYLLERENVPPEKILVLTFTKDAAVSMQNRFQQMSQRTIPVNFGTFHSVFYHIIKESYLKFSQILTEAEKKKLIFPILKQYISQSELQEEAVDVLAAISYWKNTGDKDSALKKVSTELQQHFEEITNAYEKERKRKQALDFDDMLYECYRLLKNDKHTQKYWKTRFSHILLDEFQDINPMQYLVIRLLAPDSANLFAVGDDDQSIYGFRGAKPSCLKQFVSDYHAKQLCLNINYRSVKEIIRAATLVIKENVNRFEKELRPSPEKEEVKDTEASVKLLSFSERQEQYEYLIEKLRKQKSKETIGVLFRTNSYMQGLAARLSREGIAYHMKEKASSIYDHFIVKDIMAYIKVASGSGNRALFLQIMNKPFRQIGREAIGEGMPDFEELIRYYRKEGLKVYYIKVIQNIEQWEKQMQCIAGLSPFPAVNYIRKAIGYERYLKEKARNKEQWQEWEELLNWLSMDAINYRTVEDWLEAQKEYGKVLKEHGAGENVNLHLMTVHGSKGLEFDRVYIPDCNEKIFPHGGMPEAEQCEEERRIFYVAMTRAKKNLELLYLTGTKERPRLPSRFLNKLLKDYSSTSSSNSQLSKYSSKASATRSYSSSSSMKSSSGSSLGSSGFSL